MKNYAKVGNKLGKPAYRTSSSFRYRSAIRLNTTKRLKNAKKGKTF